MRVKTRSEADQKDNFQNKVFLLRIVSVNFNLVRNVHQHEREPDRFGAKSLTML